MNLALRWNKPFCSRFLVTPPNTTYIFQLPRYLLLSPHPVINNDRSLILKKPCMLRWTIFVCFHFAMLITLALFYSFFTVKILVIQNTRLLLRVYFFYPISIVSLSACFSLSLMIFFLAFSNRYKSTVGQAELREEQQTCPSSSRSSSILHPALWHNTNNVRIESNHVHCRCRWKSICLCSCNNKHEYV